MVAADARVGRMIVTFDAAAHSYTDEAGRRLPSVTQILGAAPPWLGRFDRIDPSVLEYKRALGSAAHHATALDDLGLLDEDSLDEALVPYLAAWRKYRAESGFVPTVIEHVVHHPTLGFAGTLDRIGFDGDRRAVCLDVKTADASTGRLAGPQTAAYLEAFRACTPDHGLPARVLRCSVHLGNDGRYVVVPHTNRRDWHAFLAALELWNFAGRTA